MCCASWVKIKTLCNLRQLLGEVADELQGGLNGVLLPNDSHYLQAWWRP